MNAKEHKELFRDYVYHTIHEQSLIRDEMIGQSIVSIYYAPIIEGWDFDFKDKKVIHIPMGVLTIKMSNGLFYQMNTNYQDFGGGGFGVLLKKVSEDEFENSRYKLDLDYFGRGGVWNGFQRKKIDGVKCKWSSYSHFLKEDKEIDLVEVEEYLYRDYFVPVQLIFEFEDGQKLFFFALEPDDEIPEKSIYMLHQCGEELMIFFDEATIKYWGLNDKRISIIKNNKTPHNKV